MRTVELWSDGSGTVVGEPGGWAFILRVQQPDGSWVEKEECGACSATSNNRQELMAVIMGLRALKKTCRVVIHADSEYVLKGISEYLPKWIARDWSKVKNPDLWKELVPLLKTHDVTTSWVRGHNGTDLNERCDKMAGAQRRVAIESGEVFLPEPAGDRYAVQPALLDPDASSHLDAIAVGA